MTYIAIASFFDEKNKWQGYAISADRRIGVAKPADFKPGFNGDKEFNADKAIYGERSLSFYAGAIALPTRQSHENTLDGLLRSLQGKFDNIRDGQDIPIDIINVDPMTRFIVTQREAYGEVRLLTLKEISEGIWRASQIHKCTRRTYKEDKSSKLWHGPWEGELEEEDIGERFNPGEAQKGVTVMMEQDVIREHLGYNPENPGLYFISPNQHGTVIEGRLVLPKRQ